MIVIITSHLFEAFLECPSKCHFWAHGENSPGNSYAEWARNQYESYRNEGLKCLRDSTAQDELSLTLSDTRNLRNAKWRLATNLVARTQDLESTIHAVQRIPSDGRGKPAYFIPIRFVVTNKLTRNDKLLLAFDALVLSEVTGRKVEVGRIIHGNSHTSIRVKTSLLANDVRKRIHKIAALMLSPSSPDLVLNHHCGECEFQARCRQRVIEKDDLSLLSTISEGERTKLNGKGIFTITQLSYTFRPRRRPRLFAGKRERYHHSLKALAIREGKIHIVGSPKLKIEGTPVYLDVEGLPDQNFYYLIGIRIQTPERVIRHSLWADNPDEEESIWTKFQSILSGIDKPVLIHYGSFETTFFKRMCGRYGDPPNDSGTATAIRSSVNLLSSIFAQFYFPTYSNGLKEIARHLGFQWSDTIVSGLDTIRLRGQWAISRDPALKQALLTYNAEDCEAVEIVAKKLAELCEMAPQTEGSLFDGVVHTEQLKREHPFRFGRNPFSFSELDVINKAAYWDYQRERVYVKTNVSLKRALGRALRSVKVLPPDKIVECPRPRFCLQCGSARFFGHGKKCKTILDLKFMRHGLKRWIIRLQFHRYKCQICGATFYPEGRVRGRSKFGPDLIAYAVYQNVGLRLPQESVDRSLNRIFGLSLSRGTTSHLKEMAAKIYEETYNALIEKLCRGRLLHADETKVRVKSNDGFVWILASQEEVAYIYRDTREGEWLQTQLKDFTGVLVSDYYAAYDGIQCQQQKCLIHLIRDLNDDILKQPYDEELKGLALAFARLVKPMVDTVDRHGLKSRFLRKHLVSMRRFYRQLSNTHLHSEAAVKVKDRLEKNQNKLFTFLNFDGVPWNNNNAEHAVKAFATLRHVIGGVTTTKGIHDYMILLSICETCSYQKLDFLNFLRSGEKSIDVFANNRPETRTNLISNTRVPRKLRPN